MAIKDLIENENYVIIIDTNILLNVYRSSPEFSEFSLNCLKKVSPHIYLPATVLLEYEKHCRNEFKKMERRITKAKREINIKIESAKNQITTLLMLIKLKEQIFLLYMNLFFP